MASVKTPYLKDLRTYPVRWFLVCVPPYGPRLSYLTSEIFGGIILFVFPSEYLQLMEEKAKNLRGKFGCLWNVTWTMVNNENLGTTSSLSLHVASLKLLISKILDLFIHLFIYLCICQLFIYLFIYFVVVRGFLILKSSLRNLLSIIIIKILFFILSVWTFSNKKELVWPPL